jgi:glyoxylase-like metal-dependent hydrolase (beta-lactamase superfamily II)
MNIGKFNIDVIETGIFHLDGGAMFGVIPKPLWTVAYNSGDQFNRIPLQTGLLLIRWDRKIVLVDTGNGTKLNPKVAERFGIDLTTSDVRFHLKKFNIQPEQVTDVILTHLHFDHSGGATIIENGKIIPTFPNAKYYVQKEQYNWAINPTEKDRASFFPENYVPLYEMGLLELLDGNGDIFPGISAVNVSGHTKSMQLIKIYDNNQSAIFVADLCPTSAHIPLPYIMGYDNEPLQTLEEKKKLFPQLYEEKTIIVYEHDAFKQASNIISNGKGFTAGESIQITDLAKL